MHDAVIAQSLLGENETVRERIRFLEGIVQDVSKEKENYKAMIKQLTSSKVPFPALFCAVAASAILYSRAADST